MSMATLGLNGLLTALALPPSTQVQQRIPKKMLAENSAASLADRKLVQDRIEELTWQAVLKPTNVGVAAYVDELRSYLEVAVLVVKLRTEAAPGGLVNQQGAKISASVKRVAELVHRAIPYPTLLLLEDGQQMFASMAHIRWAQREAEKTVLDGDPIIVPITLAAEPQAFLEAMALSKQPRSQMQALYQGWLDTLSAWQAVELTGQFKQSYSPTEAAERREAMRACRDLDARIAVVRSTAAKEKQLARQVAANLEIKTLLAERQRVSKSL